MFFSKPAKNGGGVTSGWSLTGNAGTNPLTNFVGTTDSNPLRFGVNGIEVARFNLVKGFQWGNGSISNGDNSTAFGDSTTANGLNSTSFGTSSISNGLNATAFGSHTIADGENATSEGSGTQAMSVTSKTWGDGNYAAGGMATAFGNSNVAGSYAPLYDNGGNYYDALSNELYLSGDYSSLVGQKIVYYNNITSQIFTGEVATAIYSAPFTTIGFTGPTGASTDPANELSFVAIPSDDTFFGTVWGNNTFAGSTGATAWGQKTRAIGEQSTALGIETKAKGQYSFAGGRYAQSLGDGSFAYGRGVNAPSNDETAFGEYNTTYTPANDSTDRAISIGNGSGTGSESDIFTVLKNGKTGIAMSNFELTKSGAKLQIPGYYGMSMQTVSATTAFTADTISAINNIRNGSGSMNLTLPDPTTVYTTASDGTPVTSLFTFKLEGTNTANTVRLLPFGAETIDGASELIVTKQPNGSVTVYTNGTNWFSTPGTFVSPLSISMGGTGAETATDARNNLGAASVQAAVLSATQDNDTVTPGVLTGHTFTIPPGKTGTINGRLIFTSAALSTGGAYGMRVAQAASASANAQGSVYIQVNIANAAAATPLGDGDAYNVAGGASSYFEVVGTATTAGNNSAFMNATITNQSNNVNTTVTLEFRSEVATSLIQAQIGTSASCTLS